MNPVILIPAYCPDEKLLALIRELRQRDFDRIVVVNDGSGPGFQFIFDRIQKEFPETALRTHSVNQGKGAALKTGFEFIYAQYPDAPGIITADADGQHLPEDIRRLADHFLIHPHAMILGARQFRDSAIPPRSRFGNRMTRLLLHLVLKTSITDTQTGLRAIPRDFLPELLRINCRGYEYELEMLFRARETKRTILEIPIKTVYLDDNASSHFNPLRDSFRIYFVLFRYILASVVTAAADFAVYLAVLFFTGSVDAATISGRFCGACVQYLLVRNLVFSSREKILRTLPKYILLVVISGCLSAVLIKYFQGNWGISAYLGKFLAEGILYLANFLIQRDFIFTDSVSRPAVTDWNRYYETPYRTARFSRKIAGKRLLRAIRAAHLVSNPVITEPGGGNSCFYDLLNSALHPSVYTVLDNHAPGLERWTARISPDDLGKSRFALCADILKTPPPSVAPADLVFSAGLIEHFSPEDTAAAIRAHFTLAKPGGIVILLFPTPTLLYRITRFCAECLHCWIFYDERPLRFPEVEAVVRELGTIEHREILWRIFLTQGMIVIRKKELL